jgi:hypothetical protein
MTLPGLVAAQNLADVADKERAWDNLGLNISATFFKVGGLDADASAYIDAVALADGGNYTEPGVQFAINNFIVGCKADGTWNAIKASCIFAGARTLTGALVPLVGTAPTNFNFVEADYNRKTGLVGDGSTKSINSNRANNASPQGQDDMHIACWVSTRTSLAGSYYIGSNINGLSKIGASSSKPNAIVFGINAGQATIDNGNFSATPTLFGVTRNSATQVTHVGRGVGFDGVYTQNSQTPVANNLIVNSGNGRIAFYSIGTNLDLLVLRRRVTDLINAFAAAIP